MAENKWNTAADVEAHIKSAVDALTPDIYDRLDLSVPQEAAHRSPPPFTGCTGGCGPLPWQPRPASASF